MIHLPPSDEGGGFCEAKDGGRELHKALYINEHTQNHSLLQSLCETPRSLRNMVALPSLERWQFSLFLHFSTSLHPPQAAFRCFALVRGSLISRFLLSFIKILYSNKTGLFFYSPFLSLQRIGSLYIFKINC